MSNEQNNEQGIQISISISNASVAGISGTFDKWRSAQSADLKTVLESMERIGDKVMMAATWAQAQRNKVHVHHTETTEKAVKV